MNGVSPKISIATRLSWLLSNSWGGVKVKYLYYLRCYSYFKRRGSVIGRMQSWYYGRKFRTLGMRLGFSIGEDVFGYGLVLPHYGTIVVGGTNRVGNFATLHTCTCIADEKSQIGDAFDFATGSIISKHVSIGDNVSACANSCITTDVASDSLVAGTPAKVVRAGYLPWYIRDGETFNKRVEIIKNIKDSQF